MASMVQYFTQYVDKIWDMRGTHFNLVRNSNMCLIKVNPNCF